MPADGKMHKFTLLKGPKRCAAISSIAKMWCKGNNIPFQAKDLKILHERAIEIKINMMRGG
jgi:hypothetical protein